MEKTFVIMRGIPGSGKSTYVKKNFPDAKVCSADHYFETPSGYFFDASKLSLAHGHCKRSALDAMQQGLPLIVLDNTNVKKRWFKEYLEAAERHGYKVKIIRLMVDPKTAHSRGVHHVPYDKTVWFFENLVNSPILDGEEIINPSL